MKHDVWDSVEVVNDDTPNGYLAIEVWKDNDCVILVKINKEGEITYPDERGKTDSVIQTMAQEVSKRCKFTSDLRKKQQEEKEELVGEFVREAILSGDYGTLEDLLIKHVPTKAIKDAM